jgi:dihydrofolate synthase/folylpolyglutamate synthase
MDLLDGDPPLLLDAAHNPDGARALAEAMPEAVGGRPVVACLAVLEGKDAEGMVAALGPALAHAVCTELREEDLAGKGRPGAVSVPAAELARLCERAEVGAEAVPDPRDAIERVLVEARRRSGVALCAGSHYLLHYGWIGTRGQSYSR